jgi:hypothetical protein
MMHPIHVTAWGYFWLTWMITGISTELYWVAVNASNTLSRQIWGVEQIDLAHPLEFAEWTPAHYAIAITLWLFFAWLSVHFPFGYLR